MDKLTFDDETISKSSFDCSKLDYDLDYYNSIEYLSSAFDDLSFIPGIFNILKCRKSGDTLEKGILKECALKQEEENKKIDDNYNSKYEKAYLETNDKKIKEKLVKNNAKLKLIIDWK